MPPSPSLGYSSKAKPSLLIILWVFLGLLGAVILCVVGLKPKILSSWGPYPGLLPMCAEASYLIIARTR